MQYILLFYSNNSFDANLCYLHCGVKLIKLILCKWNKYKFLAINFCYKFYVYCACVCLGGAQYGIQQHDNATIILNNTQLVLWECTLCVYECVYVWLLMRWFFPNIIICKLVTCISQISLLFFNVIFIRIAPRTWFLHLSFCIVNRKFHRIKFKFNKTT